MTVKQLIGFCCLCIFSLKMTAQSAYHPLKTFSKKELIEDLSYLSEMLKKGHPGLNWYSSPSDFTSAIEQVEKTVRPTMTEIDFLNQVALLNNVIKCAHTDIRPSQNYNEYWQDSVNLIPFNVMKVNADYLICENLSDKNELQYGTKLISINGVNIQDIVRHLLPFIPADGNNESRKYYALQRGFYRYYAYYFNASSKNFVVVYENKLGQKSEVILSGIQKTTLNQRRKIQEIDPSLMAPLTFEIKDHLSTGILTIRTFRNDRMESYGLIFEDFITDCFKQLADQQSENLIIDLRGNAGGYSEYAATLFTFLADTAFKYCKKQVLTSDQLIEGVAYDIPATFAGFPDGIEWING